VHDAGQPPRGRSDGMLLDISDLQYNVDISSSALYIRVLHLIIAKFALYSSIMPILFVSL